jgi:hypothetical protein
MLALVVQNLKLRRIEVDAGVDVADEGMVGRWPTRLRTIEKVGQSRNFANEFNANSTLKLVTFRR